MAKTTELDIIILTKGRVDYLTKCINSILAKTSKTKYHVHVCDTGSDEVDFKKIVNLLQSKFKETKNVSLHKFDYYNFAKINNAVVSEHCEAPVILFCNNDVELIDNCIDRMYHEIQATSNIGTVGCRLLYKNGKVQHAGQTAFTHNPPGWHHQPSPKLEVTHRGIGTTHRYRDREEVVGNTAALMMIKRQVFYNIGGFVEHYKECFEDVQLNMESIINGYTNIYLDCVQAYHSESVTRTKTQQAMMLLEQDYFNTLSPWWNSLDSNVQNNILKYHNKSFLEPDLSKETNVPEI